MTGPQPDSEASSSSLTDALSQLALTSESHINLDSVVKSAEESLKHIEPWKHAQSNHPIVLKIINDVQKQGGEYCLSIDESIRTAEHGIAFTADAADLCRSLPDTRFASEELVEYIQEMRGTAIKAHEAAKETSAKFRAVRTGLMQISSRIPGAVADLEKEESSSSKKQGFIGLPSWLPFRSKGKRDLVPHDYRAATAELTGAMEGLLKLTESVDCFAAWWLDMVTSLSVVEHAAKSLTFSRGELFLNKVAQIQYRWEKIGGDYAQYKLKVIRLRDIYRG